jgi:hypothetical protein
LPNHPTPYIGIVKDKYLVVLSPYVVRVYVKSAGPPRA